jgi:sugar lactone lactonase YvrE
VTGDRLVRHERDGSTVVHADPSDISKHGWSENEVPTGVIAVVTPDGTARKVADSIAFPNGIAADGICLDAEGAVWTAIWPNECVRVAEGGEILDRIQLDRPCFATMLGGPQRNTLFMMTNQFVGPDRFDQMLAARGGQVLVAEVRTPGAGWP